MALDKDQKIAVASAGIGLVGLYMYYRHEHSTAGATSGNTTAVPVNTQGSIQPYNPQSPITLAPGESVYDPNTYGLYTTPSGQGPPSQFPSVTGQTTSPGAPHYKVNIRYPHQHHTRRHGRHPSKRAHHGKHGNSHEKAHKAAHGKKGGHR